MAELLDLAPELIVMITKKLEVKKVCLLRSTCKQLEAYTFGEFATFFRVIGIVPEPKALKALHEFSKHPRLSRHVQQVTVHPFVREESVREEGSRLALHHGLHQAPYLASEREAYAGEISELLISRTIRDGLALSFSNIPDITVMALAGGGVAPTRDRRVWGWSHLPDSAGRADEKAQLWRQGHGGYCSIIFSAVLDAVARTRVRRVLLGVTQVDGCSALSKPAWIMSECFGHLKSFGITFCVSVAWNLPSRSVAYNCIESLGRLLDATPQLESLFLEVDSSADNEDWADQAEQIIHYTLSTARLGSLKKLTLVNMHATTEDLMTFLAPCRKSLEHLGLGSLYLTESQDEIGSWTKFLQSLRGFHALTGLSLVRIQHSELEKAFIEAQGSDGIRHGVAAALEVAKRHSL